MAEMEAGLIGTPQLPQMGPVAPTPLEQQLQQQLQQTNMLLQQMNTRLVSQEAQLVQLQAAQAPPPGRGRLGTFDWAKSALSPKDGPCGHKAAGETRGVQGLDGRELQRLEFYLRILLKLH